MSQQIQITGGAKVRSLEGVLTGTSGVVNALGINVANGIPQLDGSGKILVSQLPNSVMEYKGTWNVATNTPYLVNGVGNAGDVYMVTGAAVGGTTHDFGAGPILFYNGDQAIYDGSAWQRASGSSGTVTSVAMTTPSGLNVSGSPITTSGTLALSLASGYTIPLSTQLVPTGGTTGQILAKNSNTAYDTVWIENYANWTEQVRDTVKASVVINKGQAVYISGANGTNQLVSLADNTTEATSSKTLGLAMQNFAINDIGQIVTEGLLGGLDTHTATAGDPVWLGTSGNLIFGLANKPAAPAHLVYIGVVTRANLNNGEIYVKIQNGFELQELHNVSITSPANGNILQYDSATSLWKNVAGTTTNIAEGTNLYYTDARARGSLSFAAGSGAYNSTTGVITIPTNNNQITNGAGYITLGSLSASSPLSYNSGTGAFSISQANTTTNGYLSSTDWNTFNSKQSALTFSSPLVNTSGTISIPAATSLVNGYLSSSDWTTFNSKQSAITLTTTGSSGSSTFVSNTLNIPTYTLSGLGGQPLATNLTSLSGLSYVSASFVKMTAAGTFTLDTNTYYLASNPSGYTSNTGTVTSVAALTIGTSGTDLSSTVANSTTTPVITLNVPTASATNRGALSSADWTTFNNKQNALTNPVTGTGTSNYLPKFTGTSTIGNSIILDNGTNVSVGYTTNPALYTFDVNGTGRFSGALTATSVTTTASSSVAFYTGTYVSTTLGDGSFATYSSRIRENTSYGLNIDLYDRTAATWRTPLSFNNTGGAATFSSSVAVGASNDGYGTLYVSALASTNAARLRNDNASFATLDINNANATGFGIYAVANKHYLSGNVGIGTTSPNYQLELGGTAPKLSLASTSATGYNEIYFNRNTTTAIAYLGAGVNSTVSSNGDEFVIQNMVNGGNLVFRTNNGSTTERMRITSGGNVGIGTASPSSITHIVGNPAILTVQSTSSSQNAQINLQSSTGTWTIGQNAYSNNAGTLEFNYGSSRIINITSGGNVNINNTSNTTYKLYVDGGSGAAFAAYSTSANNQFKLAGTAPGITISNTITSPTIGGALGACTSANDFLTGTAAGDMILINQFTGNKLYITNYTGGVYLTQGATSWTANSDIRIKNVNSNITNAVEKLSTLSTINFSYKDDVSNKENLGLIAQEVQMVFPELIESNNDGILGIRYTELIPVLVKAIQEQNQLIQQLRTDIELLKNK